MNKVLKNLFLFLAITAVCLGTKMPINSFNAGELSPLLEGRTDIAKYYSGCRTLENFTVLSYGGAQRRPGTKYIANAKSNSEKCRLIPFEHSIKISYVIEAGDNYMRFFKDGAQLTTGTIDDIDDWENSTVYVVGNAQEDPEFNTIWVCTVAHTSAGTDLFADDRAGAASGKWYELTVDGDGYYPYEIETVYGTDDLFDIQFIQSANWMYMTHPDYVTQKLVRIGDISWTIEGVVFTSGPFLTENNTAITLTPDGITGSIGIEANGPVFEADHVGAHFQLIHTKSGDNVNKSAENSGTTSSLTVLKGQKYDFDTHGTWTGTIELQRSFDGGSTFKTVLPVRYVNDGNVTYTDTEDIDEALYRASYVLTDGEATINLATRSFDVDGVVEITAVTDADTVVATVEETLGGTDATENWSEGAWSDNEGWPSCLAFFKERLCMASTTNSPQTVWMSETNNWEAFHAGDLDTDAIIYEISSDQLNTIEWMVPKSDLVIGTSGGEWTMGPAGQDLQLSPNSQPSVKRHSIFGSASIQAEAISNVTMFVQRGGRKVRELTYAFVDDAFVAPDMTVLSEHITKSGIVEMDYQKMPHSILWCVRADGELAGMTYLREQEVVGWHRTTTWTSNMTVQSNIESVAVIPGDEEDEVWLAVQRVISGSTVRYIEQLQPFDWGDDDSDAWFVDAGSDANTTSPVPIAYTTATDAVRIGAPGHRLSDGDIVRLNGLSTINTDLNFNASEDNYYQVADADDAGFNLKRQGGFAYINDDPNPSDSIPLGSMADITLIGNKAAYPLDGDYILVRDINAARFNFTPIPAGFSGSFDGQNFTISNLTIVATGNTTSGFFEGASEGADIRNLRLSNMAIINVGTITDSGLLLGSTAGDPITITNVHVQGSISSDTSGVMGGLAGRSEGTIQRCSADTVLFSSHDRAVFAGLVHQFLGNIEDCYAAGTITSPPGAHIDGAMFSTGGLIGKAFTTNIERCYSAVTISGKEHQTNEGTIGGFIGQDFPPPISSYTDCFWDSSLILSPPGPLQDTGDKETGDGNRLGITDKTTGQMYQEATFTNWDFETVWEINEGSGYPTLQDETEPSGFSWSETSATVTRVVNDPITGLDHLDGMPVTILVDGVALSGDTYTVINGTVTPGVPYANHFTIGLPYNSKLKPMKLEFPGGGTEIGATKRISDITLRLFKSIDIDVGTSWTVFDPVSFVYDELGAERPDPNAFYTGDVQIEFDGDYGITGDIYLQHDGPTPLTIIGLIPELEVYR